MRYVKSRPLRSRPGVTVLIPCYNYGAYLPTAVASAFTNPEVDVEVVIADNCSTDDSVDVARRIAAADSRVRVTEQPYNKPYLENYNDAIGRVTSEYTVLIDADDLLTPGSITRSVALMEAHSDVSLVYGHCIRFTGEPPKPRTRARSWVLFDGPEWAARMYRRGRNIILTPEVAMRTSVLAEVGGYDTEHPTGADMLLWLQVALSGHGVGRVNNADQAFYRVHSRNMHFVKSSEGLLTDLTARRRVYDLALDRAAAQRPVEGADKLRDAAHRKVAEEAARGARAAFDSADEESQEVAVRLADFASDTDPGVVVSREIPSATAEDTGAAATLARLARTRSQALRHGVGVRLNRYLEW